MANHKINKKTQNIWTVLALAVVAFAIFQLLSPIEANAPSGVKSTQLPNDTDNKSTAISKQDLTDGLAEVSILMYHHIGPLPSNSDKIRYGLTVPESDFDSQLKYIKDNNYNVITLNEFYEGIENNKLMEKIVILTFDDGYDDNFIYAKPILEKYGFKGTFFIISGKIGHSGYMSEDQVKELSQEHEIGSHSYSHPSIAKLSDYYLEREIMQSKQDLEKITGKKIISFCYPAGKYDDKAVAKLSESGYKVAVTTESSTGSVDINNLLLVPRYRIASSMSLEALLR